MALLIEVDLSGPSSQRVVAVLPDRPVCECDLDESVLAVPDVLPDDAPAIERASYGADQAPCCVVFVASASSGSSQGAVSDMRFCRDWSCGPRRALTGGDVPEGIIGVRFSPSGAVDIGDSASDVAGEAANAPNRVLNLTGDAITVPGPLPIERRALASWTR